MIAKKYLHLLFFLVFLCLQFGCDSNPYRFRDSNEIAIAEDTKIVSNVSFRLVTPDSATDTVRSLATIKAASGVNASITFRLIFIHSGQTGGSIQTFSKSAEVGSSGSASVDFTGIPVGPAIGQIKIYSGKVGTFTDFHGALDLKSGGNVMDVSPVGYVGSSGERLVADVVAQALERAILSPELIEKSPLLLVATVIASIQSTDGKVTFKRPEDIFNTLIEHVKPPTYVALSASSSKTSVQAVKGGLKIWEKYNTDLLQASDLWGAKVTDMSVSSILRDGLGGYGYVSWKHNTLPFYGITRIDSVTGNRLSYCRSRGSCDVAVVLSDGSIIVGGNNDGKGCPALFRWDGYTNSSTDSNPGASGTGVIWIRYFEDMAATTQVPHPAVESLYYDDTGLLVASVRDPRTNSLRIFRISMETGLGGEPAPPRPLSASPHLVSLTPTSNSAQRKQDEALSMIFDQAVKKGTGNITIKKVSDDSVFEFISVTDSRVSINFNQVVINHTTVFEPYTAYYVVVEDTCFQDSSGTNIPGINDKTSWNFRTAFYISTNQIITSANQNTQIILSGVPSDFYVTTSLAGSEDRVSKQFTFSKCSDLSFPAYQRMVLGVNYPGIVLFDSFSDLYFSGPLPTGSRVDVFDPEHALLLGTNRVQIPGEILLDLGKTISGRNQDLQIILTALAGDYSNTVEMIDSLTCESVFLGRSAALSSPNFGKVVLAQSDTTVRSYRAFSTLRFASPLPAGACLLLVDSDTQETLYQGRIPGGTRKLISLGSTTPVLNQNIQVILTGTGISSSVQAFVRDKETLEEVVLSRSAALSDPGTGKNVLAAPIRLRLIQRFSELEISENLPSGTKLSIFDPDKSKTVFSMTLQ